MVSDNKEIREQNINKAVEFDEAEIRARIEAVIKARTGVQPEERKAPKNTSREQILAAAYARYL